ncbi:MAG TPA: dethiobiotin synthase [Gammaproteobacteria bacterium]|nr:dethiobiotin synthase [Gammaproteobacteria bacterium]
MKTILISGNDTGIGKTWMTRALLRYFAAHDQNVQVVKVVETGISDHQKGDAQTAMEGCQHSHEKKCEAYTLYSFTEPLAPVTAAKKAGCRLNLEDILCKIKNLPETDWRILETAGGLAVPLDDTGFDSVNLALNLPVDYLLLVVQNRLGAIHQARVLTAYAPYSKIITGIWFNDCVPVDENVTQSNYAELANLAIPIWGHQLYQSDVLRFFDSFPIAHYFESDIRSCRAL